MDNGGSGTWQWLWFGGGALMLSLFATLRGYLRSRRRDRIADLEAEVASLRRELDEFRSENARYKIENSAKDDEILRLMRLLLASDARDIRRDAEIKRRDER